jgi:hypothetical protein
MDYLKTMNGWIKIEVIRLEKVRDGVTCDLKILVECLETKWGFVSGDRFHVDSAKIKYSRGLRFWNTVQMVGVRFPKDMGRKRLILEGLTRDHARCAGLKFSICQGCARRSERFNSEATINADIVGCTDKKCIMYIPNKAK